ncbi:hypothetical protein [Janthinobacterium sp. JC611]|uniref:hypothetical protein n=1 Tax=Janthinobacterium sp. JC611 TaxID=2816201 RepID=UPI001BFE18EE|nr:hypothetical protein [Janthinobacterium sp. JC611]
MKQTLLPRFAPVICLSFILAGAAVPLAAIAAEGGAMRADAEALVKKSVARILRHAGHGVQGQVVAGCGRRIGGLAEWRQQG